jgi:hypothetical protein
MSYTTGSVLESCGYAVLLLVIIMQKTVPCGRMKNCLLRFMCRPAVSWLLVGPSSSSVSNKESGEGKEGRKNSGKEELGVVTHIWNKPGVRIRRLAVLSFLFSSR